MSKDSISEPSKRCTKCHQEYPQTSKYFPHHKRGRNGFDAWCKTCHKKNTDLWRVNNRDALLSKRRLQYRTNPEKHNQWHKNNIIKRRAAGRRAKRKNREANRIRENNRHARKRALPNTFTVTQWKNALQYWNYSCAVCHREEGFFWKLAMDHFIPLNSPHCPGTVAGNILPLCHGENGCNNTKHDKDPILWLIAHLGPRHAAKKLKEIEAYFAAIHPLIAEDTQAAD